jgi:hypothetical protein
VSYHPSSAGKHRKHQQKEECYTYAEEGVAEVVNDECVDEEGDGEDGRCCEGCIGQGCGEKVDVLLGFWL